MPQMTISQLKREKQKLLALAKKQAIARRRARMQSEKEAKLKMQIANLKRATRKKYNTRSQRILKRLKSPEARAKRKRAIQKGKKLLKGIDTLIRKIPD